MGSLNVIRLKSSKAKAQYIHYLIKDLKALDLMIENDLIEKSPIRIGAEQEFCIVSDAYFPNNNSQEILRDINDDHFTTEIGQYNLEINSDPLILKNDCFSRLHEQLYQMLKKASDVSHKHHSKIVLTGILPTLRLRHISEDYMTEKPRYRVLNDSLKSSRRQNFNIHIKGIDELNLIHDSVMLEACNTSFQTHLQVDPSEFVERYNWSQAISGPVLSVCTNSPILFGRELWSETRIALFTQSIDTRANSFIFNEKQSRVSFGTDWEQGSISHIFKDNISRFRSLISSNTFEDSIQQLEQGQIPKLSALNLHNGTVYKWNRVCYGVGEGKPHLRIECRYIPSGPTLLDEIANMAFWVGLMMGQPERYRNIHQKMDFKDVKSNFFKAARYGIDTQFYWNNKSISAKELLLNELLPIADEGLRRSKVSERDRKKYLSVIEKRISKHTGANWMVRSYRNLSKSKTSYEALQLITSYMERNQFLNEGVDNWNIMDQNSAELNVGRIVKHIMNTKIFLVDEQDSLELAINIMRWKKIHHLPIINKKKELVGLLSWTDIIKLSHQDLVQPVKSVMTKALVTISQESDLELAKTMMKQSNINCLPVVRDKKLLGIITMNDFDR